MSELSAHAASKMIVIARARQIRNIGRFELAVREAVSVAVVTAHGIAERVNMAVGLDRRRIAVDERDAFRIAIHANLAPEARW